MCSILKSDTFAELQPGMVMLVSVHFDGGFAQDHVYNAVSEVRAFGSTQSLQKTVVIHVSRLGSYLPPDVLGVCSKRVSLCGEEIGHNLRLC